jgi:hypothetical protein
VQELKYLVLSNVSLIGMIQHRQSVNRADVPVLSFFDFAVPSDEYGHLNPLLSYGFGTGVRDLIDTHCVLFDGNNRMGQTTVRSKFDYVALSKVVPNINWLVVVGHNYRKEYLPVSSVSSSSIGRNSFAYVSPNLRVDIPIFVSVSRVASAFRSRRGLMKPDFIEMNPVFLPVETIKSAGESMTGLLTANAGNVKVPAKRVVAAALRRVLSAFWRTFLPEL